MSEPTRSSDCLSKWNQLRRELEAGVAALNIFDLAEFERCVQAQVLLCAQLRNSTSSPCSELPPEMTEDIKRSNRVYSSLVRRLSRNTEVLIALHDSYAPLYGKPSQALTPAGTLSCEI